MPAATAELAITCMALRSSAPAMSLQRCVAIAIVRQLFDGPRERSRLIVAKRRATESAATPVYLWMSPAASSCTAGDG